MPDSRLEQRLHQVLRGLQPYLTDLILIGGWVPDLHRRYGTVWTHFDGAEALEFLVPHRGPFRSSTSVVSVTGQPGVKAMMLTDIDFLARHTTMLRVPVSDPAPGITSTAKNEGDVVAVRVPVLGAYLINKALTFPRRTARPGMTFNPKRAKDVLYVRDVMAAGAAIATAITHDVRTIVQSDPRAQVLVEGGDVQPL